MKAKFLHKILKDKVRIGDDKVGLKQNLDKIAGVAPQVGNAKNQETQNLEQKGIFTKLSELRTNFFDTVKHNAEKVKVGNFKIAHKDGGCFGNSSTTIRITTPHINNEGSKNAEKVAEEHTHTFKVNF